MARTTKTVVQRPVERTILDTVTCDLCKKVAPNPDGYGDNRWATENYSIESVKVGYRYGECYPESQHHTTVFFDICPDCFVNGLMPILRGLGAEPQVVDWHD